MGGFVQGVIQVGTAIAGVNSARKNAKNAGRAERKAHESRRALGSAATAWMARAQAEWDSYQKNVKPHETKLIDELVRTASRPSDSMVAEAVGDVGVAFDKQQAVSERHAQRRGVDTTDAAAMERERLGGTEQALAEVMAANRARAQSRIERREAAGAIYDLSGNMMNRAMSLSGRGEDLHRDLISTYQALADRYRNASSQAWGTVGRAVNRMTSAGGIFSSSGPFSAGGAAAGAGKPSAPEQGVITTTAINPDQGMSDYQDYGAFDPRGQPWGAGPEPGRAAGGIVPPAGAIPGPDTGGRITGPGTGTSDSIRAIVDESKAIRVSAGEYIIPAAVVRKKGTEFFDKLISEGGA